MRNPWQENISVSVHAIRRAMGTLPKQTPGVPSGGSLWKRIAGVVRLIDPTDSAELATLLRLKTMPDPTGGSNATGCNAEIQARLRSATGNQDNYDMGTGTFIPFAMSAGNELRGIAGGTDGRLIVLLNGGGGGAYFIIKHAAGTSSAGNRFFNSYARDMRVEPGDIVLLWYNTSVTRWQAVHLGNLTSLFTADDMAAAAALGMMLYFNSSTPPQLARLDGNTTTTRKFLRQTGTGAASAAPAWDTLVSGDLPNDGVTFAKMQNIATARILGRTTGGTGDPEELTGAQALAIVGAASLTRIAGASGAAGADMTWQHLTAPAAANSTTTLATVMTTTGLGGSHYWKFKYTVLYLASATTTGVKFAVDFSAAVGFMVYSMWHVTTGTTGATGVSDQTTGADQLVEGKAERVKGVASSSTAGTDAAGSYQMMVIEGTVQTPNSGDLLLKHASSLAASTQVLNGTMLELHRMS